jgi:hypothetical protein
VVTEAPAHDHPALVLTEIARAELEMATPLTIGDGPLGSRIVVELVKGRFDGRLAGQVRGGSAADWIVVGADGTGLLNVRFVLETDDGALIYAEAHGRIDLSPKGGQSPAVLAVSFETAHADHAWLNKTIAVMRADTDANSLRYRVFAVDAPVRPREDEA